MYTRDFSTAIWFTCFIQKCINKFSIIRLCPTQNYSPNIVRRFFVLISEAFESSVYFTFKISIKSYNCLCLSRVTPFDSFRFIYRLFRKRKPGHTNEAIWFGKKVACSFRCWAFSLLRSLVAKLCPLCLTWHCLGGCIAFSCCLCCRLHLH